MGTRLPTIIYLPTHTDDRGSLTVMEKDPFGVKRAFWIHGATKPRGQHSHKEGEQVIISVAGSFVIRARTGLVTFEWTLRDCTKGVYIPPGAWVELSEFSEDAVALVLCSNHYDENDCTIRESETG